MIDIRNFIFIGLIFILNACCGDGDCWTRPNVDCEKYTFLSDKEIENSVEVQKAKEIGKAGKIYIYGDILLVNEANKGIHIIDNTDKKKPISKAFIKILGNIDMAVKDGYLYADTFSDLLVFDIRNIEKIVMITRKKSIFPKDIYQVIGKNDYMFYYDERCNFDSSKGMIVEVKK